MPYNFDATEDYFVEQKNVVTLIKFAKQQGNLGKENNRNLFLKLGVVLLVTRFQVFVESILKEYEYKIKQTNKLNKNIPLHFRLNSIKLESERKKIYEELKDPSHYNLQKFQQITGIINLLNNWCNDDSQIHQDMKMDTKFPLGATGLNELKKLFKQFEGKDIFEKAKFDINTLNEILSRRHAIIHEDRNQQITEMTLDNYKKFMKRVVVFIDKYLTKIISN